MKSLEFIRNLWLYVVFGEKFGENLHVLIWV